MDFTQDDRDMLKANDLKLKTLCKTTANMNTTLSNIDKKLSSDDVKCVENRADCRDEINKTFIRARTFWGVITTLVLGFLAKVFIIK